MHRLASLLLTVSLAPVFPDDRPEPLLALAFDAGMPEGVDPVDYAPGEGALILPGPWRDCLDLTAASRFGGTLQQMEPAGGALLLSDERLNDLRDFTVTLWAKAVGDDEAINARALNKMGSWELNYSRGRFQFLVVSGEQKSAFAVPARPWQDWVFVTVAVSSGEGTLTAWSGDVVRGLSEGATYEMPQPPDQSAGELQIGTYGGVRPFRGRIDNLRIHGVALSAEEVATVFAGDLAARRSGSVYSMALPQMPERRFTLNPSDIVFSSRWQSRRKEEAFELLQAYHVDHLLWVYGNSPDYIRQVHQLGVTYEGTLNGLTGWDRATPEASGEGDTTGRQQDFDGNKVVLPHMRKWSPEHPRWTGDHNSDAFRRIFFDEVNKLVEAGIDALHIDDWEMALATASNGLSGFSPETIEGFREYVKAELSPQQRQELGLADPEGFDYREHLKERYGITDQEGYRQAFRELPTTPYFLDCQRRGLRDFYATLRQHLDAASPEKYIPVSVNNQFCRRSPEGGLRGVACLDRLDFFVGEASRNMQTAGQYVLACRSAEALGIPQVMMSKPLVLGHSQAALATSYALGAPLRVPWDLYMDNDPNGKPAPRYYGELDDWKPYYDFVERNAGLFDGYRPAAEVAIIFNADEPCYDALLDACRRLTETNTPFALIGAAERYARVQLLRERIDSVRHAVLLSPEESFGAEDRATLEAVRADRRVRLVQAGDDLAAALGGLGAPPMRVEGPANVHAFLRVKPGDDPAAAVHILNWNAFPAADTPPGETMSEMYAHITISLADPKRWGNPTLVTIHRPEAAEAEAVEPEAHPDSLRITLPELRTWAILEVRPRGD